MINLEDIEQRHSKLSAEARAALDSPDYSDLIYAIGERNHFDEKKIAYLQSLMVSVFLGLIHPEDVPRKITEKFGVDARISNGVGEEMMSRVFAPFAKELNGLYKFNLPISNVPHPTLEIHKAPSAETSDSSTVNIESPAPVAPLHPTFEEDSPAVSKIPSPLVMHEHKGDVLLPEDGYQGGLISSGLIETSSSAEPSAPEAIKARLEIGGSEGNEVHEAQVAKIGGEIARVVHYAAPETPADPFSGHQNISESKPMVEKKDVPQSNVVNLKDLPK